MPASWILGKLRHIHSVKIAGVQDTEEMQNASVFRTMGNWELPVSGTPASLFSTISNFFQLQAIAAAFKAANYKKRQNLEYTKHLIPVLKKFITS